MTAKPDGPIASLCDEVIVATPEVEESYCYTASYTCAVAAPAALRGEDVSWLSDAVAELLAGERLPVSDHRRFVITSPRLADRAGGGAEAREGVHIAAEAHLLEELLHGHLAAIDESVRCFVLRGKAGRQHAPPRPPRRSSCSGATSPPCRRATRRSTSSRSTCSRSTWPRPAASTRI